MWAQKSPPKKCASISSFTLGTLSNLGTEINSEKMWQHQCIHTGPNLMFLGVQFFQAPLCEPTRATIAAWAVIRCSPYINDRKFGCHHTVNLRLWRREKWREYLGGLSYKPWEPSFPCGLWLSFDSCFFWLPGLHLCIIQSLIDPINANSNCGHLKRQWARQQHSRQWHVAKQVPFFE